MELTKPEHEVTCSECGVPFICTCGNTETHATRGQRHWTDPCPSCNRAAQEGWFAYLRTLPETRLAGENDNLTDPRDGFNRFGR